MYKYNNKKFDKKVRWYFKIAIEGYGQNVEEALTDAAEKLLNDIQDWKYDSTLEKIELHETEFIDENDVYED